MITPSSLTKESKNKSALVPLGASQVDKCLQPPRELNIYMSMFSPRWKPQFMELQMEWKGNLAVQKPDETQRGAMMRLRCQAVQEQWIAEIDLTVKNAVAKQLKLDLQAYEEAKVAKEAVNKSLAEAAKSPHEMQPYAGIHADMHSC